MPDSISGCDTETIQAGRPVARRRPLPPTLDSEPMANSRPASRNVRAPAFFVALGILIAVLPAGWLEVITRVHWEQEILHLTGLVGAGFAAVWPWSMRQNPQTSRRFVMWLLAGLGALAFYVVGGSPLLLITAFTILFSGTLDMWTARAHRASREYAERLRGQESNG